MAAESQLTELLAEGQCCDNIDNVNSNEIALIAAPDIIAKPDIIDNVEIIYNDEGQLAICNINQCNKTSINQCSRCNENICSDHCAILDSNHGTFCIIHLNHQLLTYDQNYVHGYDHQKIILGPQQVSSLNTV